MERAPKHSKQECTKDTLSMLIRFSTIIVPGIGTDLPDEWDDFPCSNPKSWIHQATARTRKRTSVLLFDHKLRVEDLVSWDTILAKGDELLDAVRQHLKNEVSEVRRIVPVNSCCY